ncbi:glycerophosphodiester phosphodiesterase family protein [Flavilitoribacter nigricans]|nr:glycerophosphodiester phosphodiesterase family protein [Flavilitoribacter nigricans]
MQEEAFDWQGHRGARGLMPENTVPAFLLALEFPQLTTLELDLAVSRDNQLIVSHEPWLSHEICSWPDGRPVEASEETELLIHQLTAEELRAYDCGSRGNTRFPGQKTMRTHKPLLSEIVSAAEQRAAEMNRTLPKYNIEIKSRPEWDGTRSPEPDTFARLVLEEVERLGIKDRTCIQSFDVRALEAVHAQDPEMVTAYLVEELDSLEDNLARLSFTPTIYSPYYMLVTGNMVRQIHERGMQIIPWTVNDTENMRSLQQLGVDGIITDYPDRIPVGEE